MTSNYKSYQRNDDHGKTTAAWALTILVIIGSTLIGIGMFFEISLVLQSGIAVTVLGGIVGYVLHQLGFGQKPRQ